jgi:hypothetical protein
MVPLPSTRDLALIPPTPTSLDQMTTLLLLILGAAVQSDQKQEVDISVSGPDSVWSKDPDIRGSCR